MLQVSVADVEVKYRTVEVPETCPMCGSRLAGPYTGRWAPVRELNLASSNLYGAFADDYERPFQVDAESEAEEPSDGVWVVFGYECAGCGELLASGALDVG